MLPIFFYVINVNQCNDFYDSMDKPTSHLQLHVVKLYSLCPGTSRRAVT